MNQVTNVMKNSEDPNWIRKVIAIELIIEEFGICNAAGAFLQALENIEADHLREVKGFKKTQHYKNLQHQKKGY